MKTNALLTALTGVSLLAFSIAGCDAGDDRQSYADRTPAAAEDSSTAADTTQPRSTDGSVAAERPAPRSQSPSMTRPGESMSGDGLGADAMAGLAGATDEDVVGQPVLSKDGEEIGRVAMIVADGNNESEFAVIEVGEFLGIGDKQVAIDVRHLQLGADGQIQSDVTADTLQSMPEYDESDYEQEDSE